MSTCSICLETVGKAKTTLECGHELCSGCWSACVATGNWTCPCCRGAVSMLEHLPNTAKLIVFARNAHDVISEERDEALMQRDEAKEKLAAMITRRQADRRRVRQSAERINDAYRELESHNIALVHELDEAQEIAALDAAIAVGCEAKIAKLEARLKFAEFCAGQRRTRILDLTSQLVAAASLAKSPICRLANVEDTATDVATSSRCAQNCPSPPSLTHQRAATTLQSASRGFLERRRRLNAHRQAWVDYKRRIEQLYDELISPR